MTKGRIMQMKTIIIVLGMFFGMATAADTILASYPNGKPKKTEKKQTIGNHEITEQFYYLSDGTRCAYVKRDVAKDVKGNVKTVLMSNIGALDEKEECTEYGNIDGTFLMVYDENDLEVSRLTHTTTIEKSEGISGGKNMHYGCPGMVIREAEQSVLNFFYADNPVSETVSRAKYTYKNHAGKECRKPITLVTTNKNRIVKQSNGKFGIQKKSFETTWEEYVDGEKICSGPECFDIHKRERAKASR